MRAAWPTVPPVAETERCSLLRFRLGEDRPGGRCGRRAALRRPRRAAAKRLVPGPDRVALRGVGALRPGPERVQGGH